jgi:flagellar export protein FliJ
VAKFRFQLEALLEMRRRAERDQQLVVAQVESEYRAIEDRIRACHESIELGRDDLRARLGSSSPGSVVNPREAAWQTHSMHRMRAEADGLVLKLSGVLRRLETEREKLVELARERRSIEKLRENRFAAWKAERQRKERIELDDLASARAGRVTLGGVR